MKHTPGPWRLSMLRGNIGPIQFVGNSERNVARILQDEDGEFNRPNANLIAAAPDLLAACKEALAEFVFINQWASTEDLERIIKRLEKSIQKAEPKP